jgi:hypothetical protein
MRLVRLAVGSYDLEIEGEVVASVVRGGDRGHHAVTWYAELLDEAALPAPFTQSVHEFASFEDVIAWLAHPDVLMPVRAA